MSIKLGTVVTLRSNGLVHLSNYNFFSIGGNENFTIPLLIVVEILIGPQNEIDEESGEEKENVKGRNKYKCVYFSDKSMRLEENWFFENEISIYGKLDDSVHQIVNFKNIKWGDIVRFKTNDEEAKKTKSYNETFEKKGAKSLITYTSPAFLVTGFANVDKKDTLIDPYNGLKKREKTLKLVKCKFFIKDSDKFSEQLIPIECLQKIDNSKLEVFLVEISNYIDKKAFVIVNYDQNKCFGKIQSVHVYSGRYQLVLYNELNKSNEFIWIDKINNFVKLELDKSEYYPGIHEKSGTRRLIDVLGFIASNRKKLKEKNLKIVYQNLKGEIISRYIFVKSISDNIDNIFYLKSYCFYRKAEREFRSDRILSIRTINTKELNDYLSKKVN